MLHQGLRVAYRGRWLILCTFIVVTAAFVYYNYKTPSVYAAYSLLSVHANAASGMDDILGLSGASANLWGYANQRYLENELVIFEQSLQLTERVADRVRAQATLPGTGQPLPILQSDAGPLPRRTLVRRLDAAVVAEIESEGVDFIRITGYSTHPEEAALLTNLFADAFKELTQERSRQRLAASRSFLEGLVTKQDTSLAALEDEMTTFLTMQGQPRERDLDRASLLLSNLEAERAELALDIQFKRTLLDTLAAEIEAIQPHVAARLRSGLEQEIELVQAQLFALEARRREVYLANPVPLRNSEKVQGDLQELDRERRYYQRSLDSLSQQYVAEVMAIRGAGLSGEAGLQHLYDLRERLAQERLTLRSLQARDAMLAEQQAKHAATLREIPVQTQALARIQREKESTEGIYLFILQKLQEMRIAEESEIGYAEIVRPADLPEAPIRPDRIRNITLGGLLGLFLGFGLAIVRFRLDTRIHRPEDLKARGFDMIGIIPKMSLEPQAEASPTLSGGKRSLGAELVTLLTPLAPLVESYRQLRTNIQFSRPDVMVQSIVVTSSLAGEGKTTTAANLALVMAQAGRRTVLIDADLRRPRLHQVFGLPKMPGLAEVLFDPDHQNLESFATDIADFYLIPSGHELPNASEVLGSRKMRDFIHRCKEQFDMVIIDAPPVLVATDAVLVATQCEGTLLVTRAGTTEAHNLTQSFEHLQAVGAPILGHVLNGFDDTQGPGYTRYTYYQYDPARGN